MIDTIFEDEKILVINKPSGLLVHGDGHTCEESLADFLIDTGKVTKLVGEPLVIPLGKGVVAGCALPSHEYKMNDDGTGELRIYRPGIVHRLDKDTSGVMIIAKDSETFFALKKEFQERTMKKEYLAIVRGGFKENIGSISVPIGRSKNDFRKWLGLNSSGKGTRGELRDAVTDYRVLGKTRDALGTEWSLISIRPRTGRTHQIRVHMKHVNHPVGGDKLYGDDKTIAAYPRLMLHAAKLSFVGKDGKDRVFEAPVPEEFNLA
ncbi:MAG: ribosomal large subunit pseudouridine synthase rRNA synthase [Candidatus Parcubacteria bacterium]|jgi:23S rRNA pseudouridine1911/1915/1917 synthase